MATGLRVTTIGLLSMVGLLFAVFPSQALAARHRSRAKAHPASRQNKVEAKKVCGESYAAAQAPRKSGQLIEARDLFAKCALPVCGASLMKKCAVLYKRMDAAIPSIIPVVTDASGATQALNDGKIEVRMDGQSLTTKLDGQAIPVNPGEHEFTFSADSTVFATQKVAIVHGQHNRNISAELPGKAVAQRAGEAEAAGTADEAPSRALRRAPDREASSSVAPSWSMYALGGVGVLGLGTAALLTTWGRKDNAALMQSCFMNCKPSSVHHIRNLYLASDIALGVGVVALAASTWLYIRSRGSEERTSTRGTRISLFDIQTTPSGAFANVQGAF